MSEEEKGCETEIINKYGEIINITTKRPKDCIDASRIVKNLYLGSYEHGAKLFEGLKVLGITHILSIGHLHQMTVKENFKSEFTYLHIELADHHLSRIDEYFEEATTYINDSIKNGGNVFVHCWAGISRSATLIIAYLIKYYCMRFTEAFETVRKARHWINPNSGFITRLKIWANQNGLGESEDIINTYIEAKTLLRRFYESYGITSLEEDEILNLFFSVFGRYHQHIVDVKEELMMK